MKSTEDKKQAILNLLQSDTPLARARGRFYNNMAKIEQQGEQGLDIFEIRLMEFEAVKEIAKVFGITFNDDGSIKQTIYEK